MNFKKGDNVKFYSDSLVNPITYGQIVKINKKTATVKTEYGNFLIKFNELNFD